MGVIFQLELEIPVEAQIQPLSPVEDVLVEETDLGGYAHQAGRVAGSFEVDLEALYGGTGEVDVAVYRAAVRLAHLHRHPAEHLKRGKAAVGGCNGAFAVHIPWLYGVQALQHRLAETEVLGEADTYFAYRIFIQRERVVGTLPALEFPDPVFEQRMSAEGIGLEGVVVRAQRIVADISEAR